MGEGEPSAEMIAPVRGPGWTASCGEFHASAGLRDADFGGFGIETRDDDSVWCWTDSGNARTAVESDLKPGDTVFAWFDGEAMVFSRSKRAEDSGAIVARITTNLPEWLRIYFAPE